MVFNCDGPGGAFAYLTLFVILPMGLIGLLAALHRMWRQPTSAKEGNT